MKSHLLIVYIAALFLFSAYKFLIYVNLRLNFKFT